jgi:hypothetical protein
VRSRLLRTTKELDQVFRQWCGKAGNIRIVTAWAMMNCAVCDGLEKARSKISTMVVGLDFYMTSPSFLESFLSVIRIGASLQGGTFHPKLYLFEASKGFCCLMGSSNFTRGGFGDNTELNICVEGQKTDSLFRELTEFINEQERQSNPITDPELSDYRDQFEKLKEDRKRLAKYRPTPQAMKLEEVNTRTKEAVDFLVAALESGHSEVLTAYLGAMAKFHTYMGLCCRQHKPMKCCIAATAAP